MAPFKRANPFISAMVQARMSTPADVAAIARIGSEGNRRTYASLVSNEGIEATIAKFYGLPRIEAEIAPAAPHWSGYIVAEDENGQVGAVGGGAMTGPAVGEVYVLYADPDRRGQGFGSAVLELLTRQQTAAGAREQWVSVRKGNGLAIPFYRARGFKVVERVESSHETLVQEGAWTLRMRRPIGGGRE